MVKFTQIRNFSYKVAKNTKSASYDKKNNIDKDNFNLKATNAYLSKFGINGNNGENQILLLDGKHMRSTNACTSIGIKKTNITSVERNRKLHNYHLKNGIYSFNNDIWTLISQKNKYNPYSMLILDAVSSIQTVSKNVENIFRNNYLAKHSILALTVTKRSRVKGANCYSDYDLLKCLVNCMALKYGYNGSIFAEQEQTKVISVVYVFK